MGWGRDHALYRDYDIGHLFLEQAVFKIWERQNDPLPGYSGDPFPIIACFEPGDGRVYCDPYDPDRAHCSDGSIGDLHFCNGTSWRDDWICEFRKVCRKCLWSHDCNIGPSHFQLNDSLSLHQWANPICLVRLHVFLKKR